MDRELRLRVEDHHPVALIRLHGFCAQLEVYKLKSEAEWQITDGKRFLIVDLTDLTFVDSAGVGVIMQLTERARTLGGQLAFICPAKSNAKRLLGDSLLQNGIDFYETYNEAINGVRRKFSLPAADDDQSDGSDDLTLLKAKMEEMDQRLKRIEDALYRPTRIQD